MSARRPLDSDLRPAPQALADIPRGSASALGRTRNEPLKFAADSPLEGKGFELPVPLATERLSCRLDPLVAYDLSVCIL